MRGDMNNLCRLSKLANALLFSFLVVLVFLCARSRFLAPINYDEEHFIWHGWLINNGSIPYRDFFESKPPVIFFGNALGLALFGLQDSLFRIVPTAAALGAIFIFYYALLKRRVVPWLSCLLTAQVALWLLGGELHDSGLNDSETYGFAFTILGFALGSLSSAVETRFGKAVLPVLSGVCFGLAVLSKELFILSVVPAWLVVARNLEGGGRNWRHLLFSAAGGLAVGLLFLAYLLMNSALMPYLHLLKFYRGFAANYCIDIGRFPRVSGLALLQTSWKMLSEELYNFNHLAFILAVWTALLLLVRRNNKLAATKLELTTAITAVILGLFSISVGYCFWKHYFLMGTTGLVLVTVIGAESLSSFLCEKGRPRASFASFVVLAALFLFVAKSQLQVVFSEKATFHKIAWDPLLAETIQQHSKPGDYILATGTPLIYVSMNRKNPLALNLFVDDVLPYMAGDNPMLSMQILAEDLDKHLPKVCYFPAWLRPRQDIWHQQLFDPLLANHHYIKVTDQLWYLPEER